MTWLIVPDLMPPAEMCAAVLQDLSLPALSTLLARSKRVTATATTSTEAALCAHFQIPYQQDYPIAPICLAADGGKPEQYYWLRADPVHLRATRDQLMLVDSGAFSISQIEAELFAQAFNEYFKDDGYLLYPLRPDRWYLRVAKIPQLRTTPVNQVTGKHIDPHLPQGADSLAWHRFYNEIQMLFFSLAVNDAREQRGELPINSLWCWGGGVMPDIPRMATGKLWTNDPNIRAMALLANMPNDALPDNINNINDDAIVILDQLTGAAQYGDYYGWREAMLVLEQNWFAPLLSQLKAGQIKQLRITTHTPTHQYEWLCQRIDLWRIWRRTPLTQQLTSL
ncbi:phosphoglycerate mutase [Sulfuriferula nivalis]|uniref:Regulatory protein, RpfE type n=1 Tax=Sulfuriferula nivalis TaxID=2675298 RepID=A0A809RHV1_9PROT|nr:phosphoglycerate mutase [Sulfuriferula nivalis]BBP01186.1 hypothetical protein SFSGTM_18940 [Sulfuriferula nivalis]